MKVAKISNVNLVEDYLLKLIFWGDTKNYWWMSQRFQIWPFCKIITHHGNVRRHIKTVHEGHKDFRCKSCEPDCVWGHIKNIHKGHKYFKCD